MKTFKVGSFHVTRIEEMLTPGFKPAFLFPDFTPDVFEEHDACCRGRLLERTERQGHVRACTRG